MAGPCGGGVRGRGVPVSLADKVLGVDGTTATQRVMVLVMTWALRNGAFYDVLIWLSEIKVHKSREGRNRSTWHRGGGAHPAAWGGPCCQARAGRHRGQSHCGVQLCGHRGGRPSSTTSRLPGSRPDPLCFCLNTRAPRRGLALGWGWGQWPVVEVVCPSPEAVALAGVSGWLRPPKTGFLGTLPPPTD